MVLSHGRNTETHANLWSKRAAQGLFGTVPQSVGRFGKTAHHTRLLLRPDWVGSNQNECSDGSSVLGQFCGMPTKFSVQLPVQCWMEQFFFKRIFTTSDSTFQAYFFPRLQICLVNRVIQYLPQIVYIPIMPMISPILVRKDGVHNSRGQDSIPSQNPCSMAVSSIDSPH